MNRNAAIGIFDSGVGGLTVSQAVRKLLPSEDIIYVADTGHAPYGDKTSDDIQKRCVAISNFLIDQGVKAIVVACNTATVSTIELLRLRYTVPIIGVEPGVKPAIESSKSGIVGILATSQTVQSDAVENLIIRYGTQNKVLLQACAGWVEAIEEGRLNDPATDDLVKAHILPLLEQGVDTLVLGCTHYAFLLPHLEKLLKDLGKKDICIVTTHDAVARQVARRLQGESLLSEALIRAEESSQARYYSSDATSTCQALFSALLGTPISLHRF